MKQEHTLESVNLIYSMLVEEGKLKRNLTQRKQERYYYTG